MIRGFGSRASALAAVVMTVLVVLGGIAPTARAAADPSDVVLVFDYSNSILGAKTTRNQFAAALERIATRVDEIRDDLVAGDATVSFVRFASKAQDYPRCTGLKLLQSPAAVAQFANCLRLIASGYRRGPIPAVTNSIGADTNYVAAMERAATHLPADSVRPALILFTDGRHDVDGVPASRVIPTRDRLFGSRSAFALLPVGMGLDPKLRAGLTAGLENLRVVKGIPDCVSGASFVWPTVTFPTPQEAGDAVGRALQDTTCTFTVAPTPTPKPTPPPQLAPILGLKVVAGDGKAEISWAAPSGRGSTAPIVDYQARCRSGDGPYIESTEGVSTDTSATVEGLTNGTSYTCEVAAVGDGVAGAWTPAGSVTPLGIPAPPAAPIVQAENAAVDVSIPNDPPGVTGYSVECSPDSGSTWPAKTDLATGGGTAQVTELTNGVDYVCRAIAENAIGLSQPSPLSEIVRPCNSILECNGRLLPVFAGILGVLALLIIAGLIVLARGRVPGYVIAVVDVVHTANIGHGSTLGITLTRAPGTRNVTGLVVDRTSKAEVRIRRLRSGGFAIRDRNGRSEVAEGDPVVFTDSVGVKHSLVLRAFDTNAASAVARGRR